MIINLVILVSALAILYGTATKGQKYYENYQKSRFMFLAMGIGLSVFLLLLQMILIDGYATVVFSFSYFTPIKVIRYLLILAVVGGCGILFLKDQLLRNKQLELLGSIAVAACLILYIVLIIIAERGAPMLEYTVIHSFLEIFKRLIFVTMISNFIGLEIYASLQK